nr:ankyrin repeat-containing protein [Tanacetum cinerariifolium]
MFLKVDFEKAFDSLNWSFLISIMEQMGFSRKWITWISSCLKSAFASVLINSFPTKEFKVEKGLRQGDPLSPFLFIIAIEALNVALLNTCNNTFHGVKVGNIHVSHLQFTDDALIMGEWSWLNAMNLSRILTCFNLTSGLKTNFHKSKLYGVGVTTLEVNSLASLIGCLPPKFPCTYLGLIFNWAWSRPIRSSLELCELSELCSLVAHLRISDNGDSWEYWWNIPSITTANLLEGLNLADSSRNSSRASSPSSPVNHAPWLEDYRRQKRSVSPPLRRRQPSDEGRPPSMSGMEFPDFSDVESFNDSGRFSIGDYAELSIGRHHRPGMSGPILTDDLTYDNLSNNSEDGVDHPAGSISFGDIITDDLTNDNVTKKPEEKIEHLAGPILPGDKLGDNLTEDNILKMPEDVTDHSVGSAPQELHSPKPEKIKNTNDETLKHSIAPNKINKSKEKDDIPAENLVGSAQIDDLDSEYTRASNVNVSNFVSVKLCGKSNYDIWKAQMKCLMRSHNMLGLIDKQKELPGKKNSDLTNRYKNLLNGWLIGSLNEEIIKDNRIDEKGAKGIWDALEKSYAPYTGSPRDSTALKLREKMDTRGNTDDRKLKKKLHTVTLEGHWWKAKSILKNNTGAATLVISDNGDTLLHVAVREGKNYFLKKLLNIIDIREHIKEVNSEGHTALHIAAIVGNKDAAELLVEKSKELLKIKDDKSKIPLACAYLNNQVNAFVYLWKVTHDLTPEKLKKDTKKEVADRLIHFVKEISKILQEEKEKETGISQQDKKIEEIGESLQEKETEKEKEKEKKLEIVESLLHTAIFNKEYELAKELVKINFHLANTPLTLVVLTRNFPSQIGFTEKLSAKTGNDVDLIPSIFLSNKKLMYPSLKDVCHKLVKRSSFLLHSLEYLYARAGGTLWEMRRFRNHYYSCLFPELVIALLVPVAVLYPIYQLLCLLILMFLFPFAMLYYISWKALAFLVVPIEKIEMKRKEHKEAKKFLKWICSKNSRWVANSPTDSPFDKFYRESLMEAVRLDAYEVVGQILELSSRVMDVINKDGHNIIQLAVINRSQKLYNLISPMIREGSYRTGKDIFKNNLLHLAGRLAPSAVLSCTTGAALQLQRQLQWRKEVEKLIEPTQHTDENVDFETPKMVFSREHASLVKDGEKWMKTTAESCSITAALIITIVFAAAITVPGGSNQETGIPLFKRKIAFNIFAVADAISLFSASTSLLVFLSILTTRFAENDFLLSLPRRLFIGLCLLFLSTTAMMLAFSTILFLVFCDERPWMLAPIGNEESAEIAKEEENEEPVKEEEKRKFQKIHGDNNPLRKRSTTCCLPLHRGDL